MTIYRALAACLIFLGAGNSALYAKPSARNSRAPQTQGNCTDCNKAVTQLPRREPGDGDSRRRINVRIDHTWNIPGGGTNSMIWNATLGLYGPGALSAWNSQGINYQLSLRQDDTVAGNDTDIRIVKDATWDYSKNGCAYTDIPVEDTTFYFGIDPPPERVIHLPPDAANWTQETLACILAHEIGHALGLVDKNNRNCPTIMNQITGTRNPRQSSDCNEHCNNTIQPQDVQQVNQYESNPEGCRIYNNSDTRVHTGVPAPEPYRYSPTCYYYYDAVDYYRYCECAESGCQCSGGSYRGLMYLGTEYYLTDYFCN